VPLHPTGQAATDPGHILAIERQVADTTALAEDLRATAILPDLEKCSLAAARAADCIARHASDAEPARLSHDLRNHMGSISGYVELILEEEGPNLPPVLLTALAQLR
jgi:hypothetical protein